MMRTIPENKEETSAAEDKQVSVFMLLLAMPTMWVWVFTHSLHVGHHVRGAPALTRTYLHTGHSLCSSWRS